MAAAQKELSIMHRLVHIIIKEEINGKAFFFSRRIAVSSSCTPFSDQAQEIHY